MLVLTNGLTEKADEGFLKVATNLVKGIKKSLGENAFVLTYDRRSPLSDKHISLNKLFLSLELKKIISKNKSPVLYIPFPAPQKSTALRLLVLSLYSKKPINAILVQKAEFKGFSKLLLKMSSAKIIALSTEAADYYSEIIGKERVEYLKTGIDTERFYPVNEEKKRELKGLYGLDPEKPVVLHVGHMKYGRGVSELLKIQKDIQILLVTSTLFKADASDELRKSLLEKNRIKLIEDYLPNIEEIYQLSDAYFFPVTQAGNCIDIPLSCLEAAACGIPVVTTDFGDMRNFKNCSGFYVIDDLEADSINKALQFALCNRDCRTRDAIMDYDWNNSAERLAKLCFGEG